MSEQLVTIASFRDLPEALLAKGKLEAAGIQSELVDDNIVRMDWFWSTAMGGIKLQVDRDDVNGAVEVLGSPIPTELPADDAGSVYQQPACPKCGSLDISHKTDNQWISAAVLYVTALPIPLPQSKAWRCEECGAQWTDGAET